MIFWWKHHKNTSLRNVHVESLVNNLQACKLSWQLLSRGSEEMDSVLGCLRLKNAAPENLPLLQVV